MVIWILFIIIIGTILLSEKYLQKNKVIFLSACFVIFISGFRYKIGLDYDNYVDIYYGLVDNNRFYNSTTEPGWKIINYIAGIFNNYQLIFLLSSIIIYWIVLKVIERESISIKLSIFLFFITPYYYWHSLSVIRQYIAIAIFLFTLKYIYEKKIVKYFIFNIIGSLFHISVIFIMPLYFLGRKELSKRFWGIMLLISGVMPVIFEKIVMTFSVFQKYAWYFEDGVAVTQGRNKYIHLIVKILLFLFVVILKDKMEYKKDVRKRVLVNIYLFGLLIFILFFNSTALRRLSYYMMILEIIVIPMIIQVKLSKKSILWYLRGIFIIYYFIYVITAFYMEVINTSNVVNENSQINTHYRMNFKGE